MNRKISGKLHTIRFQKNIPVMVITVRSFSACFYFFNNLPCYVEGYMVPYFHFMYMYMCVCVKVEKNTVKLQYYVPVF